MINDTHIKTIIIIIMKIITIMRTTIIALSLKIRLARSAAHNAHVRLYSAVVGARFSPDGFLNRTQKRRRKGAKRTKPEGVDRR